MPHFAPKTRKEVVSTSMSLCRVTVRSTGASRPTVTKDEAASQAAVEAVQPALLRLAAEAGPSHHFRLVAKPGPSDWLACNSEPGQSYSCYCRKTPYTCSTPHATFDTILVVLVVPAAANDDARHSFEPSLLKKLQRYIETFYQPVRVVFDTVKVRTTPVVVANKADKRRAGGDAADDDLRLYPEIIGVERLHIHEAVAVVAKRKSVDRDLARRTFVTIGLTLFDLALNPAVDESWVYGAALPTESSGVFSLARFHPGFCGRDPLASSDEETLLRRACKVMTHELGHLFGIKHCTDLLCLMNGANHVHELNRQPLLECPVCTMKLTRGFRWDLRKRYQDLAALYTEFGFNHEASFVQDFVLSTFADDTKPSSAAVATP
jgi:predicted Zn-dependent protease